VSDAAVGPLVQRAQRGDHAAAAALYAAFVRPVHAIVLAHGVRQLVDDVTQEVFCSVFASLPSLRDPMAFPAFVCAAARNAARDALRRRRRAPVVGDGVDALAGGEPSPAAAAAERELAARVLGCIAALPEAYRETLVMRLVEGLSGPEIAARTGLTHGSVRVNLTRGMALLRPLLQEAGLP
jgi:RNA polymerase sigma-70 factor (ECF subfamily)